MNIKSSNYRKPHVPGEPGIWVLVVGDLMVFTLFFCTFVFYRGHNVELYRVSQSALNKNFGAINTVLLVTSSWLVVEAVKAYREGFAIQASRLFRGALLCGLGFALVKVLEYGDKLRHGITPETNEFYMFYYVFTGIHFMHVLIGLGVLSWLQLRSWRQRTQASDLALIESGAVYWHMVDLLWIILFALLYLMR